MRRLQTEVAIRSITKTLKRTEWVEPQNVDWKGRENLKCLGNVFADFGGR